MPVLTPPLEEFAGADVLVEVAVLVSVLVAPALVLVGSSAALVVAVLVRLYKHSPDHQESYVWASVVVQFPPHDGWPSEQTQFFVRSLTHSLFAVVKQAWAQVGIAAVLTAGTDGHWPAYQVSARDQQVVETGVSALVAQERGLGLPQKQSVEGGLVEQARARQRLWRGVSKVDDWLWGGCYGWRGLKRVWRRRDWTSD